MRVANENASGCSTSGVIREKQIRTTRRYHFTPTRMQVMKWWIITNVAEAVGKLELWHIVGRNVRWCILSRPASEMMEHRSVWISYVLMKSGTEECIHSNEFLGNYLSPLCLSLELALLLKPCSLPVGKYTQVHGVICYNTTVCQAWHTTSLDCPTSRTSVVYILHYNVWFTWNSFWCTL